MKTPVWVKPFVASIILTVGLTPVLIYGWFFGRSPTLSADAALHILNDAGQRAVLVDVRSEAEFSEIHIVGSYHWFAAKIASLNSLEQIPADFKGKTLLLICNSGFQSAQSAQRLKSLGAVAVYSIKGGIQKWIGISKTNSLLRFTNIVTSSGTSLYRPMSLFEQAAVIVSAFGFKPLHMLLSAALSFLLLKQKAADLRNFGLGILIFLGAETACAINYVFYNHDSYLAEYLHNYWCVTPES